MKILSISTMFPNREQPNFGIFVLQRLHALGELALLKVVAPVPFCPLVGFLERYAYRAKVPLKDKLEGLDIFYQRFFSIPMILKPLDAVFLFFSLLSFCKKTQKAFDFDLIDAHLAYPDGFAAVLLGKRLNKPVTITLRGHDIFALPDHPIRKRQVIYALKKAQHIFSVGEDLKNGAVKLGVSPDKITVMPNGVNSEIFYPLPMLKVRQELGLPQNKKIVFSVGHLVTRKGFQHIIKALGQLKSRGREDILLVIAGGPGIEGDFSRQLEQLIQELQLAAQVRMVGAKPHEELCLWYNAADIFCLASEKEGYPNVVLEAMACGKPVVASRAAGVETITNDEVGVLADQYDALEFAEALERAVDTDWDFKRIVAHVSEQSWEQVANKIYIYDKGLVGEHTNDG